jgi:hypothetical protein
MSIALTDAAAWAVLAARLQALFGYCLRRGERILDLVKHIAAHQLRTREVHEQRIVFVREGNAGALAMTTINSVVPHAKSNQNPSELGPPMPTTAFSR